MRALGAEVSGFGHLGDGNLHLNIHTPGGHRAPIAPSTISPQPRMRMKG